jgi:hypothetical protein
MSQENLIKSLHQDVEALKTAKKMAPEGAIMSFIFSIIHEKKHWLSHSYETIEKPRTCHHFARNKLFPSGKM